MSRKLSPYVRVVRAGWAGKGARLSADECSEMCRDEAIRQVAYSDLVEAGMDGDAAEHWLVTGEKTGEQTP